jgi:hypothetical protein
MSLCAFRAPLSYWSIIALVLTNVLIDFEFVLGMGMSLGTLLAAIIGLISGILPAISASSRSGVASRNQEIVK